ncbi:MAG TPA: hypothetical protein VGJ05_12950 [Fimbriiglobus sp.]|jgi:hypothetical protein
MTEIGLLSTRDASRSLGIATATLYGWLGLSKQGRLVLNGQPVTITYYQTGARGQGRIRIPAGEVDRLLSLMLAKPILPTVGVPSVRAHFFPGITVPLGRPR